jgi:hypothetical protein
MCLLWELHYTAPRKACRIYRATSSSTHQHTLGGKPCIAWHTTAHALQLEVEAMPLTNPTHSAATLANSTKKKWLLSHAATYLADHLACHWHGQLSSPTAPPAPTMLPSRPH